MSAIALGWIRTYDDELTSTEHHVLGWLALLATDVGNVVVQSQAQLAEECRMTRKTLRTTLQSLESKGLLTRQSDYWHDSGKRKIDVVHLTLSEPRVKITPSAPEEAEPWVKITHKGHGSKLPISNNKASNKAIYEPEPSSDTLPDMPRTQAELQRDRFQEWYAEYPVKGNEAQLKKAWPAILKRILSVMSWEEFMTRTKTYAGVTEPTFLHSPRNFLTQDVWQHPRLSYRAPVTGRSGTHISEEDRAYARAEMERLNMAIHPLR